MDETRVEGDVGYGSVAAEAPDSVPVAHEALAYKAATGPRKNAHEGDELSAETLDESSPATVAGGDNPADTVRCINGRLVVGEPRGTFYQPPYSANQLGSICHRTDIAADVVQASGLSVFAASTRGALHYYTRSVRQDSYALGEYRSDEMTECDCRPSWVMAAVADGLSSARRSHELADFLSRKAVMLVTSELETCGGDVSRIGWDDVSRKLHSLACGYCKSMSHALNLSEDESAYAYLGHWASTLEMVLVNAEDDLEERPFVYVGFTGDGSAYTLDSEGSWTMVKNGKNHGAEEPVSNAVANPFPMNPGAPWVFNGTIASNECILIGTDGLGDALGIPEEEGGNPYADLLARELPRCNSALSFLQLVDACVYQKDDDCTGVLIRSSIPFAHSSGESEEV